MKRLWPLFIPILVAIFVCYPFFRSGYFSTDDGEWAIVRLAEMKREIRDGQIPPRWAGFLNHGYGYPLFSFTYPLPFYIGSIISYADIGLTNTIKVLFVSSVILSGIGMFFLGRELAGTAAGVISSVFYVLAPFRLVDLYQRGSLGESLSMAVFPWLCYVGLLYILKPSMVRMVACAFLMAGMFLTHNVMALLFLPWWGLFLLVMVSSYAEPVFRYLFRVLLPMMMLGFGLASYFIVPALVEKQFIALAITPLADRTEHFLQWRDLLASPWITGGNIQFSLGVVHLVALLVSLIVFCLSDAIERNKHKKLVLFLCFFLFLSWFLTNADSVYLWEHTVLSSVDFPWRMLPVMMFFLSLGTIFLGLYLPTQAVAAMALIIAIVFAYPAIAPKNVINQPDTYYVTNDATTTSADELMPIWVKEKPTNQPQERMLITNGEATVSASFANSRQIDMTIHARTPATVQVQTIYFPGWQFVANGQRLSVTYDNPQGVMEVQIPPGEHQVQGRFTETALRTLANSISLASIVLSIGLLIWSGVQHWRSRRTISPSLSGALVE